MENIRDEVMIVPMCTHNRIVDTRALKGYQYFPYASKLGVEPNRMLNIKVKVTKAVRGNEES